MLFSMSEGFCCFADIYLKMPFSEEFETSFGKEKFFNNREVII